MANAGVDVGEGNLTYSCWAMVQMSVISIFLLLTQSCYISHVLLDLMVNPLTSAFQVIEVWATTQAHVKMCVCMCECEWCVCVIFMVYTGYILYKLKH